MYTLYIKAVWVFWGAVTVKVTLFLQQDLRVLVGY